MKTFNDIFLASLIAVVLAPLVAIVYAVSREAKIDVVLDAHVAADANMV